MGTSNESESDIVFNWWAIVKDIRFDAPELITEPCVQIMHVSLNHRVPTPTVPETIDLGDFSAFAKLPPDTLIETTRLDLLFPSAIVLNAGESNVNDSVFVPTKCPMVIIARKVREPNGITLQTVIVSLIHEVLSHAVNDTADDGLTDDAQKPFPKTLSVSDPVEGLFCNLLTPIGFL
jgi:hypothetical protein